ncbi:MAG: VOC family protein [Rhodocyclaceae bacterium]
MIDHTGVTVTDVPRSIAFYEAALAPLGYAVVLRFGDKAAGFGAARDAQLGSDPGGDFWVSRGVPQTPRVHVAFRAANHAEVDAFHRAALAANGRDNGAPGMRPQYHPGYYAAFVLDPDGHNIEVVFHGSEP